MPRFDVAGVLGALLVLEAQALLDRVVQLAVAVGELAAVDEQLEALGEERVVAIGPGERRDLHRVAGDERRARSATTRAVASNSSSMILPLPHDGLYATPCLSASARSVVDRQRRVHLDADRLADRDRSCAPGATAGRDRPARRRSSTTVVPVASTAACVISRSVMAIISV